MDSKPNSEVAVATCACPRGPDFMGGLPSLPPWPDHLSTCDLHPEHARNLAVPRQASPFQMRFRVAATGRRAADAMLCTALLNMSTRSASKTQDQRSTSPPRIHPSTCTSGGNSPVDSCGCPSGSCEPWVESPGRRRIKGCFMFSMYTSYPEVPPCTRPVLAGSTGPRTAAYGAVGRVGIAVVILGLNSFARSWDVCLADRGMALGGGGLASSPSW
mmetsp:Transcript_31649/g.75932  ORF Transcript_31649/g.75932 Transcript_31649/m.75932 type:complete len:216 (-) Transcript_31649:1232-1879(-)